MDKEHKHAPSEFYYPEGLETLAVETETGIVFTIRNRVPYDRACSSRSGGILTLGRGSTAT